MRKPTRSSGQSVGKDARMSSLSGSGTRALFEVIIATFRCQKSRRNDER